MTDQTNLPSKVVRAIWFYLMSTGIVDSKRCYHTFDSRARAFDGAPIVDVQMRPVGPEEQYSGNEVFVVEIQVKFQADVQPNNPNPDGARVPFDAMVGAVRSKMLLTDTGSELNGARRAINQAANSMATAQDTAPAAVQFAKNHADMADFTIIALYQDIYGMAKSEECNWAIVQRFKVTACESKIDGYS